MVVSSRYVHWFQFIQGENEMYQGKKEAESELISHKTRVRFRSSCQTSQLHFLMGENVRTRRVALT